MGCGNSQKQTDTYGVPTKPHVFFLLGGPGSGKGTQAENLIRDYKFKHLSTGDLLRQEQEKGGEYAQTIANYIKQGKLLPSELVVKLLKKGISTYGNRRYLFDGFPRNQENWDEFKRQLADIVVVRNLLYFNCPPEILIERITERGKTSGRADDNVDTIKKRLNTFVTETIPIIRDFESRNNCLQIDATKSRQQVYEELREKLSAVHVEPPSPAQMIFVLGGPGSGKGTQCDILVKKYGFIHLSTGDLLREEVKAGTPLGVQIDAVIKEGKLVSSELMVRLIQEKIQRNNFGGRYLLDGFPRGQQNMDVWEKIMARWVNLRSVIYFECAQSQLKRRLLERGKTSGRSDDNQESIQKRLTVFNEQTKPVVEHYEKLGKLNRFDALRSIAAITVDVQKHLDSIGIFPKSAKEQRPKAIIVLGNSGSGKSTQCKTMSQKFGFIHISAGDLLREQIKSGGRHAELFSESIRLGKLVPSEFIVQLIRKVVEQHKWRGVFLLNGFPRNKENLTKWNQELGAEIDLDHMLLLDCNEKVAEERLAKRGGGRTDDNPESIRKKKQTYEKETMPVIEKYMKQNDFIHKINANLSNEEVYTQITKHLHQRGFKQK